MRLLTWTCGLTLLTLVAGALPARAGGEGKKIFESQIVRIADVSVPAGSPAGQPLGPLFSPNGTDPLDEGSIEVREGGRVDVRLREATPSQAYSVFFCRFGFGPAGCLAVGQPGALTTDSKGDGKADLEFSQPVSSMSFWAGVFVITRNVGAHPTNQFVSGSRLRPATVENQADLEIEGPISSLNAGNKSFRVGTFPQDIFTDNATEFRGQVQQFSDLATGLRVKVKARVLPDGRLLAREVEAKKSDPPRSRKGD